MDGDSSILNRCYLHLYMTLGWIFEQARVHYSIMQFKTITFISPKTFWVADVDMVAFCWGCGFCFSTTFKLVNCQSKSQRTRVLLFWLFSFFKNTMCSRDVCLFVADPVADHWLNMSLGAPLLFISQKTSTPATKFHAVCARNPSEKLCPPSSPSPLLRE